MIIAIYERNGQILKTTNLKKKEKKLGKLNVIWEQEFEGTTSDGEALLDDKIKEINSASNADEDNIPLYYWRNNITGYWLISIYNTCSEKEVEWESKTKMEYDKWNITRK